MHSLCPRHRQWLELQKTNTHLRGSSHSTLEAETLLVTTWVLGPISKGPTPAHSEQKRPKQ